MNNVLTFPSPQTLAGYRKPTTTLPAYDGQLIRWLDYNAPRGFNRIRYGFACRQLHFVNSVQYAKVYEVGRGGQPMEWWDHELGVMRPNAFTNVDVRTITHRVWNKEWSYEIAGERAMLAVA